MALDSWHAYERNYFSEHGILHLPMYQFSSVVQYVSNALWPHWLQHTRLPCPWQTPRAWSDSCPSSRWCHPTISSSAIPFSSCLQPFPESGSFPMGQFFTSGGQTVGVSASVSVLPMNIQDWFPLGWTGWISLQSKGPSSLLQHYSSKVSILWCSTFFMVQLSHPYMSTGKTIALTRWAFVSKAKSLLFNMLSRWVITFLPRSRCLLISWLQSPSSVISEPEKIKSLTVSIVSPSIWHEVMRLGAINLVFWILSFKPAFSLCFALIKRLFSSSSLSIIRVVPSAYLRLSMFLPAVLFPASASSSTAFHTMWSACKLNKQVDNIQIWHSFPNLEPVHCFMSGSNPCFLTCIQISQEAGKVVWYSHLLKNFPVCCDPLSQRF